MSQIAIPNRVYDIRPVNTILVDLSIAVDNVLLNLTSQAGILYGLALYVTVIITGAGVSRIDITVDGATLQSINIYNASTQWNIASISPWRTIGLGDAVNDTLRIFPLMIEFRSSLRVSYNVTGAGVGTIRLNSLRGVAL